jgi:hypothetical protein
MKRREKQAEVHEALKDNPKTTEKEINGMLKKRYGFDLRDIHQVKPNAFERLVVRLPALVMIVVFVITMVPFLILTTSGWPKFSGAGYTARASTLQMRVDCYKLLESHAYSIDRQRFNSGGCELGRGCSGLQYRNNDGATSLSLFYEAGSGNMLDEDNLKTVCNFERLQLPKISNYLKNCATEARCCAQGEATNFSRACDAYPQLLQCKNVINPFGKSVTDSGSIVSLFTEDLSQCQLHPLWKSRLNKLAHADDYYSGSSRTTIQGMLDFMFDKNFQTSSKSQYLRSDLYFEGPSKVKMDAWMQSELLNQKDGLYSLGLTESASTNPKVRVYFADPQAQKVKSVVFTTNSHTTFLPCVPATK